MTGTISTLHSNPHIGSSSHFWKGKQTKGDEKEKIDRLEMVDFKAKKRQSLKSEMGARRLMAADLVESTGMKLGIGILITLNVVLIVHETNIGGECRARGDTDCTAPQWIRILNWSLLGIFTAEVCIAIFAFRCIFLFNTWNLLDLIIVVTSFVDVVFTELASVGQLPNPVFLRIFRLVRLLRIVRLVSANYELQLLLAHFCSAMKSIFWGCLMEMSLILMWSIIAVEVLDPVNRQLAKHHETASDGEPYCAEVFSSVWSSCLRFFRTLMASDDWGVCERPIIVAYPWTFLIFLGALSTVVMGLGNLIIAVIVARAREALEADTVNKLEKKEQSGERTMRRLTQICHEIDTDSSGTISLRELLTAYHDHEELGTLLRVMDIQKDELECFYRLLDEEHTDDVAIEKFVENMFKLKEREPSTMLMFIKYHMLEIEYEVKQSKADLLGAMVAQRGMLARMSDSVDASVQEHRRLSQIHVEGTDKRRKADVLHHEILDEETGRPKERSNPFSRQISSSSPWCRQISADMVSHGSEGSAPDASFDKSGSKDLGNSKLEAAANLQVFSEPPMPFLGDHSLSKLVELAQEVDASSSMLASELVALGSSAIACCSSKQAALLPGASAKSNAHIVTSCGRAKGDAGKSDAGAGKTNPCRGGTASPEKNALSSDCKPASVIELGRSLHANSLRRL